MTAPAPARSYRFGPLDRSGLVLGLSGRQCLALGAGAMASGWLLDRHAHGSLVLAPIVAGAVLAFARLGGETICDLAPVAIGFALRAITQRNRWFATVPWTSGHRVEADFTVELPPFMAGVAIEDGGSVPWSGRLAGVGVAVDRRARTISATLRVHPNGFCLLDRSDQERCVAGWGDVLGGFCRERGAVSSLRWTEWMAPTGVADCVRFLDEHGRGTPEALAGYRQLLTDAASNTTGHDVLVTVTVA